MQIDWILFTPWRALAGGALIGIASAVLLLASGRIAGVSGIVGGMLGAGQGDFGWRAAFVVGMLLAPLAFVAVHVPPSLQIDADYPTLIAGGLLVGFGTRLGSGCTSGHGVCGVARASPRSIAATLTFMLAGFATVYLTRHIFGA